MSNYKPEKVRKTSARAIALDAIGGVEIELKLECEGNENRKFTFTPDQYDELIQQLAAVSHAIARGDDKSNEGIRWATWMGMRNGS